MAQKIVRKLFGGFKGLNLGATHLTRAPEEAISFENVELTQRGDVTTRKGWRKSAQWMVGDYYPKWGLSDYTYSDPITGAITQELIGVGSGLFKLVSGTLSVSYSGGATTVLVSYLPNVGSKPQFSIVVDGSPAAGFPLLVQETTTLSALRNAINALAGFQATLTPSAVCNGAQTGGYTTGGGWGLNSLTVHNAYAATTQPNTFSLSTTRQVRGEVLNRTTSLRQFYDVVGSAPTVLTLRPYGTSFTVNDLDEVGVGLYQAQILPWTEAVDIKPGALTITFSYWERIYGPNNLEDAGFLTPDTRMYNPEAHNFSLKNNSNCLMVGLPFSSGQDFSTYYDGVNNLTFPVPARKTGLMKYDGQSLQACGLPRSDSLTLSVQVGAGLSVGTYKYLIRWKAVDERGNIVYSTDSLEWTASNMQVTTTAGNQQVQLLWYSLQPRVSGRVPFPIHLNSANVSGNQVGVTTIAITPVYGGGNNIFPMIRVGDTVRFWDRAGAVPVLVARKVTAVNFPTTTTASITIAGTAVTVNNADPISTTLTTEIFRTKVGGSAYYLVDEVPNDAIVLTSVQGYLDTKADTALGYEYDGPFTGGDRHDIPPQMAILENHQGLLVGAGDLDNPDSIYWSNDWSSEYFPYQNSIDAANTVSGAVSALASDNIDTLSVFKEHAYFAVVGDLVAGGISITDSGHGDIGCPSPDGVMKVRSYLLFLSNKGPRIVKDGTFIPADERLAEMFWNNDYRQVSGGLINTGDETKFVVRRVTHWHDTLEQLALFGLHAEKGTPGSSASLTVNDDRAIILSYDYGADLWAVISNASVGLNAAGGGALVNFRKHVLARGLAGVLWVQNNLGSQYDYVDHNYPIISTFAPQWDMLDTPSLDKYPKELRVYLFFADTSYASSDPFYPHTLHVDFYKDFSTTPYGSASVTISSIPADGGVTIKLPFDKVRAFRPVFRTDGAYEAMRISGYEIMYAVPYKEEDLQP